MNDQSPTPDRSPELPGGHAVGMAGDPAPSEAPGSAAYASEGEPPIWKLYDDLGHFVTRMQRLRQRIADMEWEHQCTEPRKAAPKRRPSTDDLLADL